MRYSAQMYERKRLDQRGISQVRNQFDTDTTRPNLLLNLACFTLPLTAGTTMFFRAAADSRGSIISYTGLALLMAMSIFALSRPKRIVGQAFMYAVLSMALALTIFVGATPPDQLRSIFRLPV